jgi:hypothetical protein
VSDEAWGLLHEVRYHTVWMQMHQDLLSALGAAREDEPEPQ